MYLATYDVDGVLWRQAAATLEHPAGSASDGPWDTGLRALLKSLETETRLSTALRVELDEKIRMRLFVVAPVAEDRIRRLLAPLSRLEVRGGGSVAFAATREEHDSLLFFPPHRCRAVLPPLVGGSAWFAFDFRAQSVLNELLLEAWAAGWRISYHLNVEPFAPTLDGLRNAAKNALRVTEIPGVPGSLNLLESKLATEFQSAHYICEEYLGVSTPDARDWLASALSLRLRDVYGKLDVPAFSFLDGGFDDCLTMTRHRSFFEPLGLEDSVGCAISSARRSELMSWRPASALDELIARLQEPTEDTTTSALDFSRMPPSYEGREPYVFISYKHEDLTRIAPLVSSLTANGSRIWYDKGIAGGVEWDALIEERVQSCHAFIVFLSQAAVGSKYVRREVKFADLLSKPIIAVRLERDLALSDGLAILFNQYQMIDDTRAVVSEIERAVRSVGLR